jgi:hypothetical protein
MGETHLIVLSITENTNIADVAQLARAADL